MGPLPQLYRFLVATLVVALSLAGGVWLAGEFDLPLGGIGVGLGAGCLFAWALTHDFGDHGPTRQAPRR